MASLRSGGVSVFLFIRTQYRKNLWENILSGARINIIITIGNTNINI